MGRWYLQVKCFCAAVQIRMLVSILPENMKIESNSMNLCENFEEKNYGQILNANLLAKYLLNEAFDAMDFESTTLKTFSNQVKHLSLNFIF